MTMTVGTVEKAEDDQLYPEARYHGSGGHSVFKKLMPDGFDERLPLGPSLKLRDHSPTGFSWGYSGSGPSQLSLALLLDATSDPDTALTYYQDFKSNIVAGWGMDESWLLFRSGILTWLKLWKERELRQRQGEN